MKHLLIAFVLLASGCGQLKSVLGIDDDELVGTPVKPLEIEEPEEPAPYPPNRKIYSAVGFYSRGYLWSRDEIQSTDLYDVRERTVKNGRNHLCIYVADILRSVFGQFYKENPGCAKLTLWDMSNQFGGKAAGHISHQNGLDVDVEYPYIDLPKKIPNIDFGHTFQLGRLFVASGKVSRMFVDARVKKMLCKFGRSQWITQDDLTTETLRRFRPYPLHHDHVHIRFKCDPSDAKCVDQVEPIKGDGC